MFARLFDALFPGRCVGCGRAGTVLCDACRPRPEAARRTCGPGGLAIASAGRYAGVLRRVILLYKRGRRDAGDALSSLLAERTRGILAPHHVLVPVPTTRGRRSARGYDQSVRLARALGKHAGVPVLVALVQSAGDAQRGRSRSERLAARGRFSCVAPALVAGTRVVLVDDVVTTGATLADCAETMRRAGAVVDAAVVLARA